MHSKKFVSFLVLILVAISCSKDADIVNREPNALEKKILGKWNLDNISGYRGDRGYWEFTSTVIDSMSTPTETYRLLELRTTGSCPTSGGWLILKDSTFVNPCITPSKIIKLTSDTLIFRWYHYNGYTLDYIWKR